MLIRSALVRVSSRSTCSSRFSAVVDQPNKRSSSPYFTIHPICTLEMHLGSDRRIPQVISQWRAWSSFLHHHPLIIEVRDHRRRLIDNVVGRTVLCRLWEINYKSSWSQLCICTFYSRPTHHSQEVKEQARWRIGRREEKCWGAFEFIEMQYSYHSNNLSTENTHSTWCQKTIVEVVVLMAIGIVGGSLNQSAGVSILISLQSAR